MTAWGSLAKLGSAFEVGRQRLSTARRPFRYRNGGRSTSTVSHVPDGQPMRKAARRGFRTEHCCRPSGHLHTGVGLPLPVAPPTSGIRSTPGDKKHAPSQLSGVRDRQNDQGRPVLPGHPDPVSAASRGVAVCGSPGSPAARADRTRRQVRLTEATTPLPDLSANDQARWLALCGDVLYRTFTENLVLPSGFPIDAGAALDGPAMAGIHAMNEQYAREVFH